MGVEKGAVLAHVLQTPPVGAGFSSLLLKQPTDLIKEGLLYTKAFCQCGLKHLIFCLFGLEPPSVFTLSYSGLSPANDTGAKKKKKKQKKKKEKGSDMESTQDQPVKVTWRQFS